MSRTKGLNPEEKLQQSVARDVTIRLLEEHAKYQADAVSAAKWDQALSLKDDVASKKRFEEARASNARLTHTHMKEVRRNKLIKLYEMDEMMYEEELAGQGLSFRRERN